MILGKIVISDTFLNKPAQLTEEEFQIVKIHTIELKIIIILHKLLLSFRCEYSVNFTFLYWLFRIKCLFSIIMTGGIYLDIIIRLYDNGVSICEKEI